MKRVRIKVGGWLHDTLKQMIDEKETRFSRLRQSEYSAKNLEKLLRYGLVERHAQARTNGGEIRTQLDLLLNVYSTFKRSGMHKGCTNVRYMPTEAGIEVYALLEDALENGCEGKLPTFRVPGSSYWETHFSNTTW